MRKLGPFAVVFLFVGCGKSTPPAAPAESASIQQPATSAAPRVSPKPAEQPPPIKEPAAPRLTPVAFDIAGMKIGDSLTAEWSYTRSFGAVADDDEELRQAAMAEATGKAKGLMTKIRLSRPEARCTETIKFGGGNIFVIYQFVNQRLIGVSMVFKSDLFPTLVKLYTDKFGVQPHDYSTNVVTTKLGVQYQNEKVIWQITNGPFILEKYGSDVDDGFGMLATPEMEEFRKMKEGAQESELRKKL